MLECKLRTVSFEEDLIREKWLLNWMVYLVWFILHKFFKMGSQLVYCILTVILRTHFSEWVNLVPGSNLTFLHLVHLIPGCCFISFVYALKPKKIFTEKYSKINILIKKFGFGTILGVPFSVSTDKHMRWNHKIFVLLCMT